jgi:hypothetical protein
MSPLFKRRHGKAEVISPMDAAADRQRAENDARREAAEERTRAQSVANEARRAHSDAQYREQAAANELRRLESDARADRQAAENARRDKADGDDRAGGRHA